MKVLHFAETILGGPATHLNQLLPHQAEKYERVDVLLPANQKSAINVENAHIYTYPKTERSLRGVIQLRQHLVRHLRSHSYDILHLHSSFAGLVGRTIPVPPHKTIYCSRGWSFCMDIPRIKKNIYGSIERILKCRSDGIINISLDEARQASSYGIAGENIVTVYNGVDDAPWAPLPAGRELKKLLYVGRYDRQKGVDLLLEAIAVLNDPGIELKMIGSKVLADETCLPEVGQIDLGWLPSEAVRAAMNDCDALIVPSRWEGFGFVAIEAMRAGRPVLASRVGGLAETVIDGVTGFHFESGSVTALLDAISRAKNADLSLLGKQGRARFEENFTSKHMFTQIDKLYSKVVGATHE